LAVTIDSGAAHGKDSDACTEKRLNCSIRNLRTLDGPKIGIGLAEFKLLCRMCALTRGRHGCMSKIRAFVT